MKKKLRSAYDFLVEAGGFLNHGSEVVVGFEEIWVVVLHFRQVVSVELFDIGLSVGLKQSGCFALETASTESELVAVRHDDDFERSACK